MNNTPQKSPAPQQQPAKAKPNSKTVGRQKYRRRQWITFLRMCRYGVNNFTRNAWLTIAATAVMTITLLVVFVSVVAQNVLLDTVDKLRDQVNMSIYLKNDTTSEDADAVVAEVEKLSSVLSVGLTSPEQARRDFLQDNKGDTATIEAMQEASNQFPWTVKIKVSNINDTSELSSLVADNKVVKDHLDSKRAPSFAGSRRDAIESIGRAASFAQQLGIIMSAVLVGISMLIIFNTIRMAIFNRREEIQMMKLIGAERSFIRGPFVVEAVVYGFFAAIAAGGLGYGLVMLAAPALRNYDINIDPTMDMLVYYAAFVAFGLIALGGLIGIISSLLATRRYLKL